MLKKIKDWFSKPVKNCQCEPTINNAVAFCTLAITDDDSLIISADSKDGHDEALAKIVFLLSSGVLIESIGSVVTQKCGDDTERCDAILKRAYELLVQNLENQEADNDNDDEDDPVVDPCSVFRQGQKGVTEDDLD